MNPRYENNLTPEQQQKVEGLCSRLSAIIMEISDMATPRDRSLGMSVARLEEGHFWLSKRLNEY